MKLILILLVVAVVALVIAGATDATAFQLAGWTWDCRKHI